MRASAYSLVLAALALTAAPSFPADAAAPVADVTAADPLVIANAFLDQLDAGDFAAAEARFTAQMASAVPAAKLKAVWESLPQQTGPAKGRGEARLAEHDGMHVVVIPLHHEKAELLAQIVIDADGRIAGFFVQPAPPPPAAAPASDAAFTEQAFSVGSGDHALPATLALPKGQAPTAGFPAVVLVHGSGPQDRDETVGANRPFLDIARGLAAQGIAVLRYDKRSKARPQDFAAGDYDVDDETTNDAVVAVAALGTTKGIDPDRIHVLGHSQGAMLAPRIAARSDQVAGLIMLAAPARPLLDLLPEQNRYLLNADGAIGPAEQAFLDDLDAKIARVRSDEPMPAADAPLGVPAGYWRHFDRIDPVADALATELPMLLLQGGRDFQVIDTDWQLWRAALADRPNATLKHYPALNHLGIAGEGPGTLDEYQTPGHVDPALIQDIAEWIGR
jgi:alpha-beta hydrolase superfamily lysophospholipase